MATSALTPVMPHEMPKPLRFGMEEIVRKVVKCAVIHGNTKDLLLLVYLSGFHHGSEAAQRFHPATEGGSK